MTQWSRAVTRSENGAALERAAYRLATVAHADHKPGRRGRCVRCRQASPCATELDAQRIFSVVIGAGYGALRPEDAVPPPGAYPAASTSKEARAARRPRHAGVSFADRLFGRMAGARLAAQPAVPVSSRRGR